MKLDVALTPALLQRPDAFVCIVVDVLRASSACVSMFDSGVDEIAVAPDADAARRLRSERMPDALLCGEVGGLPPEGFDYGNSPLEFSQLDLRERRAILSTSNGTRALHAVAAAPAVLVGCLRNRRSVCHTALALASRQAIGVAVVCAGNDLGTAFSLDDAAAAGGLVDALYQESEAATGGSAPVLTDAALMARRLYQGYGGEAIAIFRDAVHGRGLERLGFGPDLAFCGETDVSSAVPAVQWDARGQLLLRHFVQEH